MFMTAYSVYLQLPSKSGKLFSIHNLRMHHNMVARGSPCIAASLCPKFSPYCPILNTLSLNVRHQTSHPQKITSKITALYVLIFVFLDRKYEEEKTIIGKY
jgi:hypothetical protein